MPRLLVPVKPLIGAREHSWSTIGLGTWAIGPQVRISARRKNENARRTTENKMKRFARCRIKHSAKG